MTDRERAPITDIDLATLYRRANYAEADPADTLRLVKEVRRVRAGNRVRSDQAANWLQALYDSEINIHLSTFWDNRYDWKLGDEMNGFVAEGNADTFVEAVDALVEAAIRCYPQSEFTLNAKPEGPPA